MNSAADKFHQLMSLVKSFIVDNSEAIFFLLFKNFEEVRKLLRDEFYKGRKNLQLVNILVVENIGDSDYSPINLR